jgi:hypothetical protein
VSSAKQDRADRDRRARCAARWSSARQRSTSEGRRTKRCGRPAGAAASVGRLALIGFGVWLVMKGARARELEPDRPIERRAVVRPVHGLASSAAAIILPRDMTKVEDDEMGAAAAEFGTCA